MKLFNFKKTKEIICPKCKGVGKILINPNSKFGEKVAFLRLQVGLHQGELAKKIKLTRTSVVNIEKGRQIPPLKTIYLLADALKVEPKELI